MNRLFLVFLVFLCSCKVMDDSLLQKIPLTQDWWFAEADLPDMQWMPAKVPGTVHTDLYNKGVIPDPFYGCNEHDLQWIGRTDWQYQKVFRADEQLLANSNIHLVFEGLDTYARVFLNGKLILDANNMFRRWEADVRQILREGDNLLEVRFASAEQRFLNDSIELGYPLPGGRWVFARKAACHFGWDWGPTFITAGIWQPVYLLAWNEHRPTDIQVFTESIEKDRAYLSASVTVESSVAEPAMITIRNSKNGQVYLQREVLLSPEQERHNISFAIDNPVLWWSSDLGEPHLYHLAFHIKTQSGSSHEKVIPYGIRTLEIIAEEDHYGESFYLKLNGVPVFMKGANYIPQHSFATEVTDEDYEKMIKNALLSNMNMLRVWGGGIYERDIFYELCDRYGILVWQDFMFACAMYPGDNDFTENVKQEAKQQIRRLRNHASLALWCGNNEVDEGWHNWQWQQTHNIQPGDSARIWNDYLKLFHELLPDLVSDHDPGRYYLPTSPLYGWGHEESLTRGSAHYWGVWWGLQPFEMYLEKVPRFMSEFGFQAMPALATIRQFQTKEEDILFSDALKCHQKHPTGYETITTYLEREGLFPETLTEYIYSSQLIQAKGVGMAIQAHRTSKPYCMGTLYWQFNDCWAVTSWSGMDVNRNWKALQYKVKTLYDDLMVSMIHHQDEVTVTLVSGLLKETRGSFTLNAVDVQGNTKLIYNEKVTIPANGTLDVISIPVNELSARHDLSRTMLDAAFTTAKGNSFRNQLFVLPYGKLQLPEVSMDVRVSPVSGNIVTTGHGVEISMNGYQIELNTNALAAHVWLYLENEHAWFDDNFFHLVPGEKKTVFCRTNLSPEAFQEELRVFSVNDMKRPY
ncbi:MAG: glycoside hydrolase family 2 protein [Bacteroidales bacterium]|nr:glycoside hydrolase family 2 protein [Bacteroidales bacterium]